MRRAQRAENIRKMKQPVRQIEIGIDELILHGFPAADRYLIGDALSLELGRLFEDSQPRDLPAGQDHIPALNAGRILLPSNVKPPEVGRQAAQAVHAILHQEHGDNRQ